MRALLRTPLGAAAAFATALVLIMSVLGPALWSGTAGQVHTGALWQQPSAEHLLGTDALGRDILARVLAATGLSVGLALLATLVGLVSGVFLGGLSALLGGRAGRAAGAVIDVLVAFPGLLFALVLAVIFGAGEMGAVLAVGLAGTPSVARLTRNLAVSVAGKDFVAAARLLGVGRLRMLVRHILPNIGEPLIVNATIGAGQVLLAFAGLSFLGLGVQPPSFDWGRLLNEGLNRLYVNPAVALAPGVAVVLAGLAFSLFGEAVAKTLEARPARTAVPPAPAPARESEARHDVLLQVTDLHVVFPGSVHAVEGATFELRAGEKVGIVGESGSGKSLTALAVAGLVDEPGTIRAGRLEFGGVDLTGPSAHDRLGPDLAMIFQNPAVSLNPALRVGRQLAEVAEVHSGLPRKAAAARAVERLGAVRIAAPDRRSRQYPHELSGGMQQRVMIASGLMERPKLIIADEPTTALDTTVQEQVLRLLDQVCGETDAALLLISHDITVITRLCERVLVFYAGTVVEDLDVHRLAKSPAHPYTKALLAAVPTLEAPREQRLAVIPGSPPSPVERPEGCPFAPRCAHADDLCRTRRPRLAELGPGHRLACWHPQHDEHVEGGS
ncbi:dipeptide/oligopeptide/nickel ABC transporter permease/ATP-binding protein [Microtetraspora malaysiensis]|uniref:Dipeptide/oligopeptide/nickel ABC transporter permease/ATP-binding protein n=1 Tax=Microtetraspora malaysiensis TaxID=161358 RepID=A0ABW6T3Y9_9ACTN